MKKTLLVTTLSFFTLFAATAQNAAPISGHYFKLVQSESNPNKHHIELSSDVDPTWYRWKERGYSFGFSPSKTPMYTFVNGILSTPYMIQVRGNAEERNKKRWGYHVFEGYAKDDKSRITMLLNKHMETGKPVAELYYYSTVYNHGESAYNWFRIGSDVRQHSFLFSRDKALFYGSLKLTNALTLGGIGKKDIATTTPEGDDEVNAEADARFVNYKELKGSGDGTLFYDKDRHMVIIKINGQWMRLAVEKLPKDVKYDF